MKTIGIVGGGTMGSGIAQVCAQNGYQVVLYDLSLELAQKGKEKIRKAFSKLVEKGKLPQREMDGILEAIAVAGRMEEFGGCDLVIEAIVERMESKQGVLRRLEEICKEDAILATNTSSLSVTEMSGALKDPSRLVGIHFFNPVHAMKLVEIVRSVVVSDETIKRAQEFARSLQKQAITAQDTPGFLVNYLQYPFRLNAIRMVERGMATPEEIDLAAKLGLGHPMGPLELQDMVGLDVTYNAVCAVYEETKDPAMAPPVLLRRMVQAGLLGKKTGRGFYRYDE